MKSHRKMKHVGNTWKMHVRRTLSLYVIWNAVGMNGKCAVVYLVPRSRRFRLTKRHVLSLPGTFTDCSWTAWLNGEWLDPRFDPGKKKKTNIFRRPSTLDRGKRRSHQAKSWTQEYGKSSMKVVRLPPLFLLLLHRIGNCVGNHYAYVSPLGFVALMILT